MKSRIKLSGYSLGLSVVIFLVMFVACFLTVREKPAFFVFLTLYVILLALGLLYGAAYIKATPTEIVMGSLLHKKKIMMRNVRSVELFQPTMGAISLFASAGFMGYWGMFKEGDIGRYYGFYGRASDCFLVRMANGDKYVLGCKAPAAMVDYIKANIH